MALVDACAPGSPIACTNGLRIIVLALVPSVQRHARLERRCPRPIAEALDNAHMAKPGWP